MNKTKLIAIIISSTIILSGTGVGTYFIIINSEAFKDPNIEITVTWDEPTNINHIKSSDTPDYVEVYKKEKTSSSNLYDLYGEDWDLVKKVNLEHDVNENVYRGYTYIEYKENFYYYIKVPQERNEIRYYDYTCERIDTDQLFNYISLHWWETFTENITLQLNVLWDEPPQDLNYVKYNISEEVPTNVEVWIMPHFQFQALYNVIWDDRELIELAHVEDEYYYAETVLQARSDLVYMIKPPLEVNDLNVVDNLTLVVVDKELSTNNITIHHWKNLFWNAARKPAIYLYNLNGDVFTDSLSIHIPNGFATITIPQIQLGCTISWNNLEIFPDSKIVYQNKIYTHLFYEAEIHAKSCLSNRGWEIKKEKENYVLNDNLYKLQTVKAQLYLQLRNIGLYDIEVIDFIDFWFDVEPLFTDDGYHYLIQYENSWIESNFQIKTEQEYTTNRIFFAYIFSYTQLYYNSLLQPKSNIQAGNPNFILHEWGIII
ncbi:MAG: hypothetical protein ACTSU7_03610 [Candidatus Heimdallarchaeaceae archaeon]